MATPSSEERLNLPAFGKRLSLRQTVVESLRGLLISGQMKPGELYSAPKLAEQFGISATPVREAMLDLVAEGLIEVVRNKGFRVTKLSSEELDELAEIRRLIEPPIMAAVAANPDPVVKEQVEALRIEARAIVEAAKTKDFLTYVELDTQFHLKFLALHGNQRLVAEVKELRGRSRLFGLDALSESGRLERIAQQHEQLVDLALAGDAPGIKQLMEEHIDHIRQELAEEVTHD
ncbi:GntR family transcriptional regulator [Natronoglycomyces albus]|uniref:GntR family transcriptional regulator n=1 Tax=Natronoglycomyces albus TaxID=2811108 RepID=A0A895XH39_9ACTN|nr:GntR family transcriptional regulator [Natronoglycomyces albus]QSB05161.1 GntR family transcriptional regulator [Natronoglycomyces albus]